MAKLNAAKRNKLPSKDFAVPGRKYPVPDASHARNALARVAQHGTPKQKAEVRAKVKAKFPGIGEKDKPAKKKVAGAKRSVTPHRMHAGKGGRREHNGHEAIGSHPGYHLTMGKKK